MRILHVWSQSGVASILAKYQRKLGHEADVIKRYGFDKYGIDHYYNVILLNTSCIGFYREVLKRASKYDIVHIHSLYKLVPLVRFLARKPVVLHFHGSEVRGKRWNLTIELAIMLANHVFTSTPDLLSLLPEAEWLPNPVDTEMFKPSVEAKPMKPKELEPSAIPYRFMPHYLRGKDMWKEEKPWALRKASLEALAVGTNVEWNGLKICTHLPSIHDPKRVAQRTLKVYQAILSRRGRGKAS